MEDRRSGAMRLLALLAAFERADGPLSFGELTKAADLAPSTARRLLGELLDWGGVERTTFGQYRLGPRLRRAPSEPCAGRPPGANTDPRRAHGGPASSPDARARRWAAGWPRTRGAGPPPSSRPGDVRC